MTDTARIGFSLSVFLVLDCRSPVINIVGAKRLRCTEVLFIFVSLVQERRISTIPHSRGTRSVTFTSTESCSPFRPVRWHDHHCFDVAHVHDHTSVSGICSSPRSAACLTGMGSVLGPWQFGLHHKPELSVSTDDGSCSRCRGIAFTLQATVVAQNRSCNDSLSVQIHIVRHVVLSASTNMFYGILETLLTTETTSVVV